MATDAQRRAVGVFGRRAAALGGHGPRRGRRRISRLSRRAVQHQDRSPEDRFDWRRGRGRGGLRLGIGAHFGATGNLDVAKGAARGHFSLTKFRLAELYPYYADAINLEVHRGLIDLAGDFDTAWSGTSPQFALAQGSATLADLELAVRGERDPLWRVPHGDLGGIAFDLAKRTITIDRIEARPVSLRVVRQADGVVNFERLLPASAPSAASPAGSQSTAAQGGTEWSVVVKKLLFERMAADFEDQMPQPPVKLLIADARITAENVGNVRGTKSTIDLTARIGSAGRAHAAGMLATRPFALDWKVDLDGVELLPLRPYFEGRDQRHRDWRGDTAKGRLTAGALRPDPPRDSPAT